MTGSSSVGFATSIAFLNAMRPAIWNDMIVRIHVVIGTVIEHDAEIHHGKSREISARRRVA